MKRRRIGPAYERSPAELCGRWIADNSIRLVSAIGFCILFCLATEWIADYCNFLATDGKDNVRRAFNGTDPIFVGAKIAGSAVLFYFILFRFQMKSTL